MAFKKPNRVASKNKSADYTADNFADKVLDSANTIHNQPLEKRMTFDLDLELYNWVEDYSKKDNRSKKYILTRAIRELKEKLE